MAFCQFCPFNFFFPSHSAPTVQSYKLFKTRDIIKYSTTFYLFKAFQCFCCLIDKSKYQNMKVSVLFCTFSNSSVGQSPPVLRNCSIHIYSTSVQFNSVAQSCPTLCDPMNHSTPGLPVHHQLPDFTQIHVRRISGAIQPSHPLLSPSPPAPNPSQHQSLFQ